MSKTAIQWTDETLNPARGCSYAVEPCADMPPPF